MIRLSSIRKHYPSGDTTLTVLDGVSLEIQPGEYVALMGPSGSGKSTLMHILGLLDQPDSGSYLLEGREVAALDPDSLSRLRREAIGFVFQQFHLLPRESALENVQLPLRYVGRHDPLLARSLLERVGLSGRAEHRPNQLSGGQQQRVAIARALVNRPRMILADEPTGNLDSQTQREILAVLDQLNAEGITIVLVTHEEDVARHARRIVRLRDGRIVSDERRLPEPVRPAGSAMLAEATAGPSRATPVLGHLRDGVRALAVNRLRTALSLLGILIGVAAVIAMLALGRGAKEAVEAQLSGLGSNLLVLRAGAPRLGGVAQESGSATRLSFEDIAALRAHLPEARQVAPAVTGRARVVYGAGNWSTSVLGVSAHYERMRSAAPMAGRFFTEEEDLGRARVALVGLTVVRELFGDGNPVGETVRINRQPFLIIGVLPAKGSTAWRDQDDIIVMPVHTAMQRLLGKSYLDYIDIEAPDAASLARIQDEVIRVVVERQRVPASQADEAFHVRNLADVQSALSETSRVMSWLLAAIAAISLVVGGIGIMNILLVTVSERTREIGLRKAVGARDRDILAQFLVEALLLGLVGGLLGVATGLGVAWAMNTVAGWNATVSADVVLLAFGCAALVGVAFGWYPARRAARLSPIVALRYE